MNIKNCHFCNSKLNKLTYGFECPKRHLTMLEYTYCFTTENYYIENNTYHKRLYICKNDDNYSFICRVNFDDEIPNSLEELERIINKILLFQ